MPCEFCDDTGWKPIERNGIRRVVRCDCRRARIGQERLADANIPKRYQHCTIANFHVSNDNSSTAVTKARGFAGNFPIVDKGLLLKGQPGVGKTHLAVAVLKQVIKHTDACAMFYDTRDLLP